MSTAGGDSLKVTPEVTPLFVSHMLPLESDFLVSFATVQGTSTAILSGTRTFTVPGKSTAAAVTGASTLCHVRVELQYQVRVHEMYHLRAQL